MSGVKDDGGPAFPFALYLGGTSGIVTQDELPSGVGGASLRDVFAGLALMGFLAGPTTKEARDVLRKEMSPEEVALGTWQAVLAFRAYGYADAMLAERAKK
jgi:hypothetical protein